MPGLDPSSHFRQLLDLPTELLVKVAYHIESREQLVAFGSSCARLKDVCAPFLYSTVYGLDLVNQHFVEDLLPRSRRSPHPSPSAHRNALTASLAVLPHLTNLRSLALDVNDHWLSEYEPVLGAAQVTGSTERAWAWQALHQVSPLLKVLRVSGLADVRVLRELVRHAEHVEELHLDNFHFDEVETRQSGPLPARIFVDTLSNMPALHTLAISGDEYGFAASAANLRRAPLSPCLRTLHYMGELITEASLDFISSQAPCLHELHISVMGELYAPPSLFRASFPNLTSLRLSEGIGNLVVTDLSLVPNLQRLYLDFRDNHLWNATQRYLPDLLPSLHALPKLNYLSLHRAYGDDFDSLPFCDQSTADALTSYCTSHDIALSTNCLPSALSTLRFRLGTSLAILEEGVKLQEDIRKLRDEEGSGELELALGPLRDWLRRRRAKGE
ncbi:hypothetical protein JCM11641_007244 [Rhodosporidiobolus odoratus]